LGEHVTTVRAWLVADKEVPRKQRHTARRVWQRLVEEEGVEVAESSVNPGREAAPGHCRSVFGGQGSPKPCPGCRGRGRLRGILLRHRWSDDEAVDVHPAPVTLG